MPAYIYFPVDLSAVERFEGPENSLYARHQAETKWGSGGELYKFVSPTGLPPGFVQTQPGVWELPPP
jgi:hypothetical protein